VLTVLVVAGHFSISENGHFGMCMSSFYFVLPGLHRLMINKLHVVVTVMAVTRCSQNKCFVVTD